MFNWLRLTLVTIILSLVLQSNSAEKVNEVTSPDGSITWYKGTGRVIITAPHGGKMEPQSIPSRGAAGCVKPGGKCDWSKSCQPKNPKKCRSAVIADTNSKEIALKMYETLVAKGLSPHLIINNLHRGKLDPNREQYEATQGNKNSLSAYQKFHNFTASAKASIDGPGLLIEIHGQGHIENWNEIGYRISKEELMSKKYNAVKSSIRSLAMRISKDNLGDLITGEQSFGGYLQRGIPNSNFVPSPKIKAPNKKSLYFRGGFNIAKYGSINGGCVDAIQLEVSKLIRKASIKTVNKFAVDVANVLQDFMQKNRYFEPNEKKKCPR